MISADKESDDDRNNGHSTCKCLTTRPFVRQCADEVERLLLRGRQPAGFFPTRRGRNDEESKEEVEFESRGWMLLLLEHRAECI